MCKSIKDSRVGSKLISESKPDWNIGKNQVPILYWLFPSFWWFLGILDVYILLSVYFFFISWKISRFFGLSFSLFRFFLLFSGLCFKIFRFFVDFYFQKVKLRWFFWIFKKFEAGTVGSRARNWDGPSLTKGSKTKTTPKMKKTQMRIESWFWRKRGTTEPNQNQSLEKIRVINLGFTNLGNAPRTKELTNNAIYNWPTRMIGVSGEI